ncbi:putative tail tubular protein B [uncultured Mediterranean phage uvMED]|nr:putative tail tubular protein B [uncultured Mediterranean phage uvMED]
MSRAVSIQTNFTTGEIDPLLKSRIDIDQYYNSLEQARNVVIQPQGGITRRPGLQYVSTIPSAAAPQSGCRLVPFEFSTTQSYMLLFVHNRMYIYKDKVLQTNINGTGNDYLVTTITSAMISTIDYAQSADTLIVVQEDMAPKKITRGASHTTWTIADITFEYIPKFAFSLSTSNPAGTITPSAVDGNITITASSSVFSSSNVDDYVEAVDGIGRARITRFVSGTSVEAIVEIPFFNTSAIANGSWLLEVDYVDAWSNTNGYPRTVTFHEGRLYFGGSKSRPNTIFASRVGRFFDFNPGEALDDDAIEVTLNTGQVNAVTGLFSGRDLQIFTKGGEFFLPQSDLDPITPSNVVIQGATKRGSKEGIKPVGAESGTMFIQRSGKSLREFLFSDVELSYISNNISLLSSHLLVSPTDLALRKATSTDDGDLLLIVNNDGSLATYSILRGQNVIAPSLSSTDGEFINVAVDVDTVYVVVKRTVNSNTVYYVETWNDDNTTDSSILFTGGTKPTTTTLSGLSHLQGKTVKVIADDAMQNDKVVNGSGQITLDAVPTTYVEVGLNYTPTVKTMPVELKLPSGNTVGQKKRIVEASALLYLSQNLTLDAKDFAFTAASFFTGKKRRKPMLGYDREGQLTFSQSAPLFFTLLGVEYKVSVGQ